VGNGGHAAETDNSGHTLAKSKRALERVRRAQEAVRVASEAKDRAQSRWRLTLELEFILGGALHRAQSKGADPEEQLEKYKKEENELLDEGRKAAAEERRALEELAAASEELQEVTVEPRVEGLKLQFETRKLQATLSAGVVLGTATITELLLPPDPSYSFLLWAAYGAFLLSLYGSLSDMQRLSTYVENVLISGRTHADEGLRERVANWMLKINQRLLSLGVLLFAVFVTLNLA
jgi:hypothetical protein